MEWGLTIACDSRVLFQNITSFTKNLSDFADTGQILSILYAYRNMGLAYLQTGRPKEAIRCFEKALSLEDRADTKRFLDKAYEGAN
jgi:tetratricopeptide (TPR) repeat protein